MNGCHHYDQQEYPTNPPYNSYRFDTIPIQGDGRWHHYCVTLPDTLTERVSLQYLLAGGSGIYNLWLDDVQLGPCGYGDFTFANLTANSCDVVWQSVGATAARVRLTGGSHIIDTVVASDTIHFTGLDSSTVYWCFIAPIVGSDTLCLSYAGAFVTPAFFLMEFDINGIAACNPFDENDTLPKGWLFSDSTAIHVADGSMRINPGPSPDTIWLPSFRAAALYIAARGLSGYDTLYVDGTPTPLDTVWRHYCFMPSTVPGHRVALRIATGSATGGCLLDNVGFSSCPIIDFTPEGNKLHCQVRGGYNTEYLLTLTDDDGLDRTYHIDQSNYTIEGLPPSTHFTAQWQCLYCGGGCMPTLDVQTAALPLPYCVDFADVDDMLPEGWKLKRRNNDSFYQYNNYRQIYSNSPQHWTYIILPEVENYTSLSIAMEAYLYNNSVQMEVGVLTNPTDTSTFFSGKSFSRTDVQPFEADLSLLPHGRVAIRLMSGSVAIYRLLLLDAPMITPHLYRYNRLTLKAAYDDDYAIQGVFNNNSSTVSYSYAPIAVDTSVFTVNAYNSSYNYLHIRQLNADNEAGCFSPIKTIPVHRAKTLPYCQTFQSGGNYEYHYVYKPTSSFWNRSSEYNNETNSYDYFLNSYISSRNYFSFPYFLTDSDSAGRLSASFNYRYTTSSGTNNKGRLVAGVLVDAIDSGTFVPVDTIAMTQRCGRLRAISWSRRMAGPTRHLRWRIPQPRP